MENNQKNMKKMRYLLVLPLLVVAVAVGAAWWKSTANGAKIPATDKIHDVKNAVYYWRTSFSLTDDEQAFIEKNRIGRMYLRMFDVVEGENQPVPNATVEIGQTVPEGMEVVPTVFITVEAMRSVSDGEGVSQLSQQIVERVKRICEWNSITNWQELQLDCDWTGKTRDKFFLLCEHIRKTLPEGKRLSSTIRLHQLQQPAPPVDYGVLMVYNTDDFTKFEADCSILNDSTVEAYLNRNLDFDLPLDIALPVYQWNLVFDQKGKFKRISTYSYCEEDEIIKNESVPFETLKRTQSHLNKYLHLKYGHYSKVLYHLNEKDIKNYSDEQIKNLYSY